MRSLATRAVLVALPSVLWAACGGESEPPREESEPMEEAAPAASQMPAGTVTILAPADGSEVDGPSVTVQLESTVPIVEAGDTTTGTGHHHVFLDADVSEPGMPIPTVPGQVIHMGDGSSELVLEEVAPGEHRLIAVVGDGLHVPLQPWVVDTVTFTVR